MADNILGRHLEAVLAFYKITSNSGLHKLPVEKSEPFMEEVFEYLKNSCSSFKVSRQSWPSAAAAVFHIWPSENARVGIRIVVSRLAPFYYTEWIRKEAWDCDINVGQLISHGLASTAEYQRYSLSTTKPIPDHVKRLSSKLTALLVGKGLVQVSEGEIKHAFRSSRFRSGKIKKTFKFYYFHSVPLVK